MFSHLISLVLYQVTILESLASFSLSKPGCISTKPQLKNRMNVVTLARTSEYSVDNFTISFPL